MCQNNCTINITLERYYPCVQTIVYCRIDSSLRPQIRPSSLHINLTKVSNSHIPHTVPYTVMSNHMHVHNHVPVRGKACLQLHVKDNWTTIDVLKFHQINFASEIWKQQQLQLQLYREGRRRFGILWRHFYGQIWRIVFQ